MNFKKLTNEEMKNLGIRTEPNTSVLAFAKKYYPPNVVKIVVKINSEYNDNTYDNRFSYLVAYDKNDDEVLPFKKTANECRSNWRNICEIPYETEEPLEERIFLLEPVELYKKED